MQTCAQWNGDVPDAAGGLRVGGNPNDAAKATTSHPSSVATLTLEIGAEASQSFDDADLEVVRDNTRALEFEPDATGFSD